MFDAEFELDIVAKTLRSKTYRAEARRVLKQHKFTDPYLDFLWKAVANLPADETPTAKIFLRAVEKAFPEDTIKQDAYLAVAVTTLKHKPTVPKTALDELTEYVRFNRLAGSIEKSIKLLHFGKVEEAYQQIDKLRATDIRPRNYNRIKWVETWKDRMHERKDRLENPTNYISIPTRLEMLDSIIVGLQLGELGLVMGTTGRGKSIFLTHLAFWSAMYGFPTIYYALEMPTFQVASRLDSKFLNISYAKLKSYDLDREDLEAIIRRFRKFSSRLEDKLDVVSIPPKRATINSLIEVIDEKNLEAGNNKKKKVKCVVVDSADHLQPIGGGENIRVSQSNVYWDLKWLVSEDSGYDLAAWSSTHAASKSAGRIAKAEDAAESYDKPRVADIVLTLNQNSDQELRGTEMDLFLAKYRDGKSKVLVPLAIDFERMHLEEREIENEDDDEEED